MGDPRRMPAFPIPALHMLGPGLSPSQRGTQREEWEGRGCPGGSAGKESACNAGDPGSIPGSGSSRRRDQLHTPVFLGFPDGSDGKESIAMWDICVQSLGREDPLEEGMATHSSILAWSIPWTEEPGRLQSLGSQVLDTTERLSTQTKIGH